MKKRETATWFRIEVSARGGRFVRDVLPVEVRVMVRAEGYAMVRRKGCSPFVVSEKELRAPAAPHG